MRIEDEVERHVRDCDTAFAVFPPEWLAEREQDFRGRHVLNVPEGPDLGGAQLRVEVDGGRDASRGRDEHLGAGRHSLQVSILTGAAGTGHSGKESKNKDEKGPIFIDIGNVA